MELNPIEARVVGSLIEKAFLTPDIYPMTTNAIVSACNQKTNREPVVSLDAVTVDAALLDLRQRNIVRRVHTQGSRSTKHRHTLDEALELDTGELALVSVLLLRGPQTVGELRLRTERQHGFESIEAVDAVLESLAARPEPLVRQLPRAPGQKESRWQHLLGSDDDLALGTGPTDNVVAAASAPVAASAPSSSPVAPESASADADLVARVAELEARVDALRRQLEHLADQLGESLHVDD